MSGRILFHVQHLLGIGHLRRAAILARAFAAAGHDVVLTSGGMPAPEIDVGGARFVQLKPVRSTDKLFKVLVDEDGIVIDETFKARRAALLVETLRAHRPDILIVELFPFGRRQMRFELLPLVEAARALPNRPRIVSSVRDILVQSPKPERVAEMVDLFERWFDDVMVHGDPAFIPFARTFPEHARLAARTHHTGYVIGGLPGATTFFPSPPDGQGPQAAPREKVPEGRMRGFASAVAATASEIDAVAGRASIRRPVGTFAPAGTRAIGDAPHPALRATFSPPAGGEGNDSAPASAPVGTGEVIVSAGGGAVGGPLLRAALEARALTRLANRTWRILCGTNLPAAEVETLARMAARAGPNVIVEPARRDFTTLLANATLSISQGGYNTVIETLSVADRAVIAPYSGGLETEQGLRADLLAERGAFQVVAEDSLSPATLAAAIERAMDGPSIRSFPRVDANGLARTMALIDGWLADRAG